MLFSQIQFGRTQLKNRIVMAPMTRSRAPGGLANKLMARYYAQRAEAGLIITEGTAPSPHGLGYIRIPGLYSSEQVESWKIVTEAVHKEGGKIFVQLMHTGRVSQPEFMPPGARVQAPSPVPLTGTYATASGPKPYPVPAEMTEADIETAIQEFATAARNAIMAGFDGVELHGANGYLIDQFLNLCTNRRQDRWGGATLENRTRFAVEVATRTGQAIGFDRLGIRLSPFGAANEIKADDAAEDVAEHLAIEFNKLGLLYIHIVDHSGMGRPEVKPSVKRKIRERFGGIVILSGGYNAERAEGDLLEGKGDLIAFGRAFISNPTLVTKLRDGLPLTAADVATFYSPGEKGYTDYP